MEHIGGGGVGALQGQRPRLDMLAIGPIVDAREAAVRRARTILVGGVHRRVAGVEVDRSHVETRVELPRIAAPAAERSGEQRDVPSAARQLTGEGSRDLRRSTTREEQQAGEHFHHDRPLYPRDGLG